MTNIPNPMKGGKSLFRNNFIRPFTINDLKRELRYNEHLVRRDIERAGCGQTFTIRLNLPATCFPARGMLCFEYGFGRYAMYFGPPVTYIGHDPNMRWLCEGRTFTFDFWHQLVDFCLSLPD